MRKAGLAGTAIAALLVGGAMVVVRNAPPGWNSANGVVDSWIGGMAESSGDRGWSWLSAEAQNLIYGGVPVAR